MYVMENQKKKEFQIKEPINAFTHFLGFLMSKLVRDLGL